MFEEQKLFTAGNGGYFRNRLIFANPCSSVRDSLMIRLSYSECRRWLDSRVPHT